MNVQALVARNTRRLRVARKISQDAFAVDAGIDRAYVSERVADIVADEDLSKYII